MNIKIVRKNEPLASSAKRAIKNKYKNFYNASINPDPDYYIVAEDLYMVNGISSCAGISFKDELKLFSEQYLDDDIDRIILDVWGRKYAPETIAEIGGLISNNRNSSIKLTTLIPFIAHCVGAKVLLCTITQTVARLLRTCGIRFEPICNAEESSLDPGKSDWGSYYQAKPVTGVIFLDDHSAMFKALSMSINFDYDHEALNVGEAA